MQFSYNFLEIQESYLTEQFKKYKYGHLGSWYIKLTLFKRF